MLIWVLEADILQLPKNRLVHPLSSPVLLKADKVEMFSAELRRQHIDFILDEVSETSCTAVVVMVEH